MIVAEPTTASSSPRKTAVWPGAAGRGTMVAGRGRAWVRRFDNGFLRSLAGGNARTEILEGGFILVVAVSIAAAGPAVWSNNTDLVREQILQLLLAALGTALCMVERSYARRINVAPADVAVAAAPQGAGWFSPWR